LSDLQHFLNFESIYYLVCTQSCITLFPFKYAASILYYISYVSQVAILLVAWLVHLLVLPNLESPWYLICVRIMYVFVIARHPNLNVVFCKLIDYYYFIFFISGVWFIQIMALLPKLPHQPQLLQTGNVKKNYVIPFPLNLQT
jgi:hypothetical protein